MQTAAIILLSVGFGAYRVWVEPTSLQLGDTYKDLAHLFVGGLFVGGWPARWTANKGSLPARACWVAAVGLTVLEIVCAVMGAK